MSDTTNWMGKHDLTKHAVDISLRSFSTQILPHRPALFTHANTVQLQHPFTAIPVLASSNYLTRIQDEERKNQERWLNVSIKQSASEVGEYTGQR